jgi:hypothetical protein
MCKRLLSVGAITLVLVIFSICLAAQQTGKPAMTGARSPYRPTAIPKHARDFYQVTWGVDSFSVRSVESGEMIRFSYQVVNVEKAKALNDKKATPFLIDETAHVKLVVPTMEKVGQLRQTGELEEGRVYWMVFSNKGRVVKPGNRVSIVIGKFRVDGLFVEGS